MHKRHRRRLSQAHTNPHTAHRARRSVRNPASSLLVVLTARRIPLVLAIVVLLFLHRRHLRKLKEEDVNDPHKSLDFGMDPAMGGGKKGKGMKHPEMSAMDAEKSLRHGRGLSMDVGSPYILPAGLQGSRESFHSMSRSMHDPDDPYRPVTFIKGDNASIRSGSRLGGSVYTSSSGGTGSQSRMKDGLLNNAQRMSQSFPPRGESMSPQSTHAPEINFPERAIVAGSSPLNPGAMSPPPPPPPPPAASQSPEPKSQYSGFAPMNPPAPPAPPAQARSRQGDMKVPPSLPRIQSQEAVVETNPNTNSYISNSSYGEGVKVTPPSPPRQQQPEIYEPQPIRGRSPEPKPLNDTYEGAGLGVSDLGYDPRRLSMSVRPLPPDDPTENPEERANRIRSFYKEYFDDSKPEPTGGHSYTDYYEDYGSEYLDGAIFDPETGAFVVAQPPAPFAQPVTRRAMTPPPRAPPRFQSGSRAGHMSGGSNASSARFQQRPRGMSTTSGRMPGPRKPMPPPAPLAALPTPHMLKDDSMIFNATDFAPPVSYRERQIGRRPDSPLGGPRPYSPAVRPHTPLVGAFDDLAVMPSPHALRKSGTFTALDFAPPPRFRDPGSGASDAGSIRSNRSGMSQAGRMAIRAGANRVSKIPLEVVNTKDGIVNSLRPQMNMVAPA
ncbi:hypothetical protein BCR34DRAFT_656842 [Clohesyomyces aquaticus]|uniref:Uncharacterized protein n=1 Tax=Clohesyomyces aquaticus TaxID=1231657 RepID=A0A1Y1ZGI3_9PLEO|nr:hypothetical protein BCR34DRAFT_656842 [Clohesyomyces aquaticus]